MEGAEVPANQGGTAMEGWEFARIHAERRWRERIYRDALEKSQ
jgi:hypothetical protein